MRAEPPGLGYRHRRVNAEGPCLVGRGGHHAAGAETPDDHRLADELGVVALLDRSVERIHVGVQDDLCRQISLPPGRCYDTTLVSYYPVFLDLRGRPCLVVGGGAVAHAKIVGLLRAGATVTVVARTVVEAIEAFAARGEVTIVSRPYASEDIRGFGLVVAATDQPEVNRRVAGDARSANALVNVVDAPEISRFIAPAVLERGDLQVAVSTSGVSPAFAAFVRDRVADGSARSS